MNGTGDNEARQPRVWVLTGHKAGDNTQVLALAGALGWPTEVKHFRYRATELLSNRVLGVTLAGIDRSASSTLEPPWPDLVITAGRRNEPVARWIQRRSGGHTRLVHVGRPWAPLEVFDLIVTTPQYFLPECSNVLHNELPLHGLTQAKLAEAAREWAPRLAGLPRPWTALLIGGDSGPFVFTPEKGRRLGRRVDSLVRESGGALLVTDSARTPAAFMAAFEAELGVPAHLHHWSAGASENPYLAYLGLADRLVVTGESMSMLGEAAFVCKPLYIFDPGDSGCWWRHLHAWRYKPLTHRLAMRFAPRRMRRDVGEIQRHLVASGRAVWLGQPFPPGGPPSRPPDDLERAVLRVQALFDHPR